MSKKLAFLTYTHSSYFDVLRLGLQTRELFFPESLERGSFFLAADIEFDSTFNTLIYDNSLSYTERLISVLLELHNSGYEWVVIDHEDMFINSRPDVDYLYDLPSLAQRFNLDQIRFLKTTNTWGHQIFPHLFRTTKFSPWLFSIQPSLWRIEKYIKLLSKHKGSDIWTFESRAQHSVRWGNYNFGFLSRNSQKRGKYHYDNDIYPFVATAIVKGEWNFKEYPKELNQIFSRYNFYDKSRGRNDDGT